MRIILLIACLFLLVACNSSFDDCTHYCAEMNDCGISILDGSVWCTDDMEKTEIVKEKCFVSCLEGKT